MTINIQNIPSSIIALFKFCLIDAALYVSGYTLLKRERELIRAKKSANEKPEAHIITSPKIYGSKGL